VSMEQYREHAADAIRVPQQGEPEAILSWVRLPNGKIRLYASRKLADTAWGQRDNMLMGVVWHLDVNMSQVLVVDRDTPAEAMQWVIERWMREDAEESARAAALEDRRKALGR
jgi:hypothetical protein